MESRFFRGFFVPVVLMLLVHVVFGEVLYVGSGGYGTIQSAINACSDDDVVIVKPGTYYENISTNGKVITIQSTDPNNLTVVKNTIINGGSRGSCISIENYYNVFPEINGFTIKNGSEDEGGGIYCYGASPTIKNCIFLSNHATGLGGGGICCYWNSDLKIINCTFLSNTSTSGGGILGYYHSEPEIINCAFINNSASSYGGGLYMDNNSKSYILNCTFYGNVAGNSGGGIGGSYGCAASVYNNILWANSPEQADTNLNIEISYSCIQNGYSGTGNISDDPNFVDVDGSDNQLGSLDDSVCINPGPCVDAGDYTVLPSDESDLDEDGIYDELLGSDLYNNLRLVNNEDVEDTVASYYPGVPAVDMGACEWQRPVTPEPLTGDLNDDGAVNMSDLAIFSSNWCKGGDE